MYQFFLNLIRDPKLYQYAAVGGVAAIADLALFFLLRSYIELHYLLIATMSFLVATLLNYALCTRFVFNHVQQRYAPKARLALTYLVSGIGLCIHHSCLFLAFEWLMQPILISKIFAMGVAFGWNFLSRKYLVFTAQELPRPTP